jgi:hypothetical protein
MFICIHGVSFMNKLWILINELIKELTTLHRLISPPSFSLSPSFLPLCLSLAVLSAGLPLDSLAWSVPASSELTSALLHSSSQRAAAHQQ